MTALVSACTKKDTLTQSKTEEAKLTVKSEAEKQEETKVLSANDFKIYYSRSYFENKYNANISWPKPKIPFQLKFNDQIVFDSSGSDKTEVVIPELPATKTQIITVRLNNSGWFDAFVIKLEPKQDFVLSGPMNLDSDLIQNEGRIYLRSDAVVYIRNRDTTINAPEIYAEKGAVITNFQSDEKAGINKDGIDGGLLQIETEKAAGHLRIVLNSQSGGQGKHGFPAQAADSNGIVPIGKVDQCYGDSGGNAGNAGSLHFRAGETSDFRLDVKNAPARGGSPGELISHWYAGIEGNPEAGKKSSDKNLICNVIPHKGEDGRPGEVCTQMSKESGYVCK